MEPVTLILTVGGWGDGPLERTLRAAHQAAARDLVDVVQGTGLLAEVVIATDDARWTSALGDDIPLSVDEDAAGDAFHFGRRLAGLVQRTGARRVLYSGGGSAPLMRTEDWRGVLEALSSAEGVLTNNLHSCDWVGFPVSSSVLDTVAAQTSDNGLAWVLAHRLGLPVRDLPPSAGSRFDLDTPIDLLIARRHPGLGPTLRHALRDLDWEDARVDGVLAEMGREGGSLMVAGRVSSAAWAALERATRCWVRVFAEERGMRASGRQARGEVRSLLAEHLALVGEVRFFETLAALSDAVLFDNRVVLAARGLWPTAADRFNADLLRWERIEDPFLRRFTCAAAQSGLPLIWGGHAVVAGGLLALVEAFQMGREEAK
jgi:CTP:molybdopterin cytidylyltransferase MocA